ncbi:MAG TPA: SUMF1/EgtB/PvdO family nonheme iron enzyme [Candidatus Paceibacterota bacterium]|nr:SUMF1/EgtB/PvdO family nonheme iron enzyme [Candidatus Paceibacterota bacterium]
MNRNSFTLIELLVVVSIISILAVFVIMTLNPAELLKQGRDSQRISDLDTINHALGLFQVDNIAGSLGTASITYVSIPDPTATSTTLGNQCGGLNLPILPSGWSYHCSASSTYRNTNGTGWLPVNFSSASLGSPLGSLPVDPVNSAATTTADYYTYSTNNSGWVLKALTLESAKEQPLAAKDGGLSPTTYEAGSSLSMATPYVFPINWVKVPGNGTYGTSDFWVMKYDAKCVQASTNLPLTSPDTGYHTYSDSSQNCSGSYYPASAPDGYPIANITHTNAVTYCSNIGAHLLTNDEYMTIARNAEQVSSNWSGGSPGSGYMYSGHNDNAPATALTASTDDTQGYSGETNTGGNQRRTLTLSNGSVVWDFAGNVWQHVQRSVMNVGDLTTTMNLPSCTGGGASWAWCQFPSISAWTADVAQSISGPSNTGWNSTQGVGQVYTYGTGGNQATTVFLRGGSWDNGATDGPFALLLAWTAGSTYSLVGFRCAR